MKAQPMKDAPRDGTPILVKHTDFGWLEAFYDEGGGWASDGWQCHLCSTRLTAWAPRPEEE